MTAVSNSDVVIGRSTFIRITGPTANYEITGFEDGVDGKILIIANNTGFALKFTHDDPASLFANRLLLFNNADVTIAKSGGAIFSYSAAVSKWFMVGNSRP